MNIKALAVAVGMCLLFGGISVYIIEQALQGENNFDLLASFIPCSAFPVATSSNMVVLRLDDVQAYAWHPTTERIIEDALARHMPMVLAVIPQGLRDDWPRYKYLRTIRCNVEFAVHGWDHIPSSEGHGEFFNLSKDDAEKRIAAGMQVLDRMARSPIRTFIPPNNEYSTSTAEALIDLHFDRVSVYGDEAMDGKTATFDFEANAPIPPAEIISDCAAVFKNGEHLCTIMIHPQDYTSNGAFDPAKYAKYRELLTLIQSNQFTVVRFEDVYTKVPIPIEARSPEHGE